MICLDQPTPGALNRAATEGYSFHHSDAFQEWVIITRDARWKRAVLKRYKMGVGVYTLDEIETLRGMAAEDRAAVHLFVREFGAHIQ